MGFFYFLGRKKFYIHLVIAIVLSIVLFWLAIVSLDNFTRHGEVFLVPDFKGKTITELEGENYGDFFQIQVIDSVFDQKQPKGSVIMQHPLPGSRVKHGRHIYLTIVSEMPETVMMPNLKNLSLRQALVTLESMGIKVSYLKYVDYFARNAVIGQLIDNEPVEPGTEIEKGTFVVLEVGMGDMATKVPVPLLIAKKQNEAKKELMFAYLNVGKEYFLDGEDTSTARVYKTEPAPLTEEMLSLGSKVDLWYRSDENFNFKTYLDQFLRDSLAVDTLIQKNIIYR